MKTLVDLYRERSIVGEGVSNLLRPDKMKYYTDSDWTNKKLVDFTIIQDTIQDEKDLEKEKKEFIQDLDKDEKDKNSDLEEPKEGRGDFPLDKDGKIDGKVHVNISKLYEEIEDNIRSTVKVFLYDVLYNKETIGTLKISNSALKELAVNPYEYTRAILSLDDSDLNIKIRAEKSIKESLYVNEAMSNSGFGAIIGGITGLFSGRGTIFTLGSSIFGAIFGSIKDKREKDGEKEEPLWKRILDDDEKVSKEVDDIVKDARSKFISETDPKDFSDSDVSNMMDFFYNPKTGLPRSADEIRNGMKDVDPKDVDALISKAQDYHTSHKAEVEAMREWSKNLSEEERSELDKQGQLNFQRLSSTKDVERDDKDIKTLEEEIKKLDGKTDDVSRKALSRMQKELSDKKEHRKKATERAEKLTEEIKEQTKKVDQIKKDHPKPSQAELDKKERELHKDDLKEIDKQIKDLDKQIKSGKDENGNKYSEEELKDLKKRLSDAQDDYARIYGGGEDSEYYKEYKAKKEKDTDRELMQMYRNDVEKNKKNLEDIMKDDHASLAARDEALKKYKASIEALDSVDKGCKEVKDSETIISNTIKKIGDDKLAKAKNDLMNASTEEEKASAMKEFNAVRRDIWVAKHPEDKDLSDDEILKKDISSTKSKEELEAIRKGHAALEKERNSETYKQETETKYNELQELQSKLKSGSIPAEKYNETADKIRDLQNELTSREKDLSDEERSEPGSYKDYIKHKSDMEDAKKILDAMKKDETKTKSDEDYEAYEKAYKENMDKLTDIFGSEKNIPDDIKSKMERSLQTAKDTHDVAKDSKDASTMNDKKEVAVEKVGVDKFSNEQKQRYEELKKAEKLSDEDKLELRKMEAFIANPKEGDYDKFSKRISDEEAARKAEKKAEEEKNTRIKELKDKIERGEELDPTEEDLYKSLTGEKKVPKPTKKKTEEKIGMEKLSEEERTEYEDLAKKDIGELTDDDKKKLLQYDIFVSDNNMKTFDDAAEEANKQWQEKSNAERNKAIQDARKSQKDAEKAAAKAKPAKIETAETRLDKLSDEQKKDLEDLQNMKPEDIKKDPELIKRARVFDLYLNSKEEISMNDAESQINSEIEKETKAEAEKKAAADLKTLAQLKVEKTNSEQTTDSKPKMKLTDEQHKRQDELAKKDSLSKEEQAELRALNAIGSGTADNYEDALAKAKADIKKEDDDEKERVSKESQIYALYAIKGKDDETVKAKIKEFNDAYPKQKFDAQKYINDEIGDLNNGNDHDTSEEDAEVSINGERVNIKVQKKTGKRGGKYFRTKRDGKDWSEWQNGTFDPKKYKTNESLTSHKANILEKSNSRSIRLKTLRELKKS